MSQSLSHDAHTAHQFGSRAADYVASAVHAAGEDLAALARFAALPHAAVLDLGCGGGHVTYAVAPQVRSVTALDLSQAMLDAVVMRQLEEFVEQAEFVHHVQGRGMDRVAAEVAQEVTVLFQHHDLDPRARQQEAQHHAGGPAAHDAALGLQDRHSSLSPDAKPISWPRAMLRSTPKDRSGPAW